MNIVLIGMMGSGKSTIGRQVAKRLGWKFYDSDKLIEEKQRMSIADLFAAKGEEFFREAERNEIAGLARRDRLVIATGGGAPCFEENWKALSMTGWTVWIKVSAKKLYERLSKSPNVRPLLKGDGLSEAKIAEILNARAQFYERANDVVETENLTVEQAVEQVLVRAAARGIRA